MFEDTTRGEKAMQINYQQGQHEITITGASVVPEFPYYMIGAIAAAVIGTVAIVTRNARFRENATL